VSHGPGSHLLAELVPQLWTSPPYRGGLRRCHVSHGSRLCLHERRALTLPRIPQFRTSSPYRGGLWRYHVAPASPPREESSGASTYHTDPSGLWTTGIKKDLATPGTQLDSHVSKARSRVIETLARRADRPVQFSLTVQRSPN
jgi:hypothetical protein